MAKARKAEARKAKAAKVRAVGRLLRARTGPVLRNVVDAARQLDGNAKLTVLLSDLPFEKSDLVGALTELLLAAAKARDTSLVDSIDSRLLKAGVTSAETKEVFEQALLLDNEAKFTVLLSALSFSGSDLAGVLTEPLLSAAKARDASLADRIARRLVQAGVTASRIRSIFQAACKLDLAAKLVILLSPLPFCAVDLAAALRDPLLSAADARAEKVVQSIARRILRANVETTWTTGILEEVKLKPCCAADLASLRSAICGFAFFA